MRCAGRARAGLAAAALTLAIAGLAPRAAAAPRQTAVPTSPAQEAHRAAVRTERTAAYLAAWERADDAHRTAARRRLERDAARGAPLGARPSVAALSAATRLLRADPPADGAAGPPEDELTAFADSLDLQVRPGAFAAAEPGDDDGRGAPLTVRVYRLWHLPAARDAELSLFWIGPDGARLPARREPFGAGAFRGRGFDMYVRAPRSAPGVWRLQPVVRVDGRDVAGPAVPVECVANLDARLSAVEAQAEPSGARPVLADLLARGLRRAEVRGADDLLRILETPERGLWHALAEDSENGVRPGEARIVGRAPEGACRGALVFLWSGGEDEELPVLGPAGEAWRALAAERELGIFTLVAGAGEVDAFRRGLELVTAISGSAPILIARGTSATTASILIAVNRAEPVDLAGFVIAQPAPALPRLLPAVPVLAILAEPPALGPREGVTLRVLGSAPLFAERELPQLVGDWLSAD